MDHTVACFNIWCDDSGCAVNHDSHGQVNGDSFGVEGLRHHAILQVSAENLSYDNVVSQNAGKGSNISRIQETWHKCRWESGKCSIGRGKDSEGTVGFGKCSNEVGGSKGGNKSTEDTSIDGGGWNVVILRQGKRGESTNEKGEGKLHTCTLLFFLL
jgi:hypothetical protein